MKGKWILAGFVITVLIVLNFECFARAETPVLKIGFTGPLSGAGMPWGYGQMAGLQLAMDDINKAGGLKVGKTLYTLKDISYDTKYSADAGVTAAKRLIFEDKVKIIFGEPSAAVGVAMVAITEQQKVIFMPVGYTRRLLGPDKPYTFRFSPTNFEVSGPIYAYLRREFPEAKRLVYVWANDETGQQMYDWVKKKCAPENGFEVIDIVHERGTVDMTPIATKIIAANGDIVDLDGTLPGDKAQIINTLRSMGYNKTVLHGGWTPCEDLIAICGKNANGFICHEFADFTGPNWAVLVEKYRAKKYSPLPKTNMLPSYDGAMILFKAIQKAGAVDDTDAIRKGLESIKSYEGLDGTVGWAGKELYGINHQLMRPIPMVKIVDEKPTIIFKLKAEF